MPNLPKFAYGKVDDGPCLTLSSLAPFQLCGKAVSMYSVSPYTSMFDTLAFTTIKENLADLKCIG